MGVLREILGLASCGFSRRGGQEKSESWRCAAHMGAQRQETVAVGDGLKKGGLSLLKYVAVCCIESFPCCPQSSTRY